MRISSHFMEFSPYVVELNPLLAASAFQNVTSLLFSFGFVVLPHGRNRCYVLTQKEKKVCKK